MVKYLIFFLVLGDTILTKICMASINIFLTSLNISLCFVLFDTLIAGNSAQSC